MAFTISPGTHAAIVAATREAILRCLELVSLMVTFMRLCATMTASGEGKDRVERLEHQVLDIIARLEVEFGGVNAEDEG